MLDADERSITMSKPIDIIATWPKTRSLDSYLEELQRAYEHEFPLNINYRVANWPHWEFGSLTARPARCYMIHSGFVRGYNNIRYTTYYEDNEVARVENDSFAGFWPKGKYIVRHPKWFPVDKIPMRGFQGWRWFDYDNAITQS